MSYKNSCFKLDEFSRQNGSFIIPQNREMVMTLKINFSGVKMPSSSHLKDTEWVYPIEKRETGNKSNEVCVSHHPVPNILMGQGHYPTRGTEMREVRFHFKTTIYFRRVIY